MTEDTSSDLQVVAQHGREQDQTIPGIFSDRTARQAHTRQIIRAARQDAQAGANLPIQYRYLAETARPDGSAAILLGRLAALRTLEPGRPVMLDVIDPSYPRIVSLYTRGHPTTIVAGNDTLGVEGFIAALDRRLQDPRTAALLPYGGRGVPNGRPG